MYLQTQVDSNENTKVLNDNELSFLIACDIFY